MISEGIEYRQNLILDLYEKGFSDKEISKYLNEKNLLSPRGREYYPSLIWSTRKKLRNREVRKENYKIDIEEISFYLKNR